jgi:hypothetical protein
MQGGEKMIRTRHKVSFSKTASKSKTRKSRRQPSGKVISVIRSKRKLY